MSEIATLRTHPLSVPLRGPFVTAQRTVTTLDTLVVSVTDADGRIGWGEAALSWQVTGESSAGAEAAISGPIAAAVVGLPADDPSEWGAALARSVVRNSAAKAAVDSALWDLAAQAAEMPLHRLLDPTSGSAVVTDMTVAVADDEEVLRDAAQHVEAGFGTLKIKLGLDPERDDRIMRALRAGPAGAAQLRVDANQGWTAEDAIRIIRGWEEDGLDVELVEQPTPADDIDSLAWVTAAVTTPVLADESLWGARDLREIVRLGAADLVNIKLAKCGGITPARELVSLAAASDVGVLVGSMLESAVGISAAAHLAVTLPGVVHDLDAGTWQQTSPVEGGVGYEADQIVLTETAGLGIDALVREPA
ncbi:mandelate racemase/muconate lactonizing enzyme family protein [Ruania alba]|uniref:Dipeptide epimerase n=1 Tax=Ruania alba TaxID=648782 RepID=A0A1H5L5S0_9MICO|nr:dipeptide epimerase [Ruania alba]SEE71661.1 L-alanine-DL-glutamate epimerase [Ruania alba]